MDLSDSWCSVPLAAAQECAVGHLGKPRNNIILQLEPDSSATVVGAYQ